MQSDFKFHLSSFLYPLVVVLICVATFHRVVDFEFTNWDDRTEILTNPYIHPPGVSGLVHYWTHGEMLLYMPVTWTVWLAIGAVSWNPPMAMDAAMFHGMNLVVHSVNVLIIWLILRRLSGRNLAAFVGALLFAVHPLQVETVAWMSGLKDLLAAMFSLIGIWFYISVATVGRRDLWFGVKYGLIIVCLILGELSKPSCVVAPMMMFVIDVGILKRSLKQGAQLSVPLLCCCVPLLVVAWGFQHPGLLHVPILLRPLLAVQVVSFYITKLFWPVRLVPVYALTPGRLLSDGMAHWLWMTGVAAVVIAIGLRRRWPELGVGLALFVVSLLPVLGFVEFSYEVQSAVADHYVYLSMFGVALAACFGLKRIAPMRVAYPILVAGSAVILVTFGLLSFWQANYWQNSMTLFTYNERIVPESWTVHLNIGGAAIDEGLWGKGLEESEAALGSVAPSAREVAYQHIGRCELELGRAQDAVVAYEESVRLDGEDDVSRTDLAIAYARAGRHGEAVRELKILAGKHPGDERIGNTLREEERMEGGDDLENLRP